MQKRIKGVQKREEMFQLDSNPRIIGRETELDILQTYLKETSECQGNVLFISGEEGVGKTRLVTEVRQNAHSSGFQILTANCLFGSHTPYMPFLKALRSGGLESLFLEETPNVEAVYLLTQGGLLIKEVVRKETSLNPDIFASMITSVGNFVKESLSKLSGEENEGAMNALGYEDFRILIDSTQNINLVVILTGCESEQLVNDIRETLSKVQAKYGNALVEWDGDEKNVKGIETILQTLISSGKYEGIYNGKENSKARRNLLFENVSMGLIRQSQKTPILLCIEDLHWADASTLALIHYVARKARKAGLFILGTFQPEELIKTDKNDHSLVDTMQLMRREDLHRVMELKRLPRESINEFLNSLLKENNFNDALMDRIFNETEGNPLFIIQLVKFLVDEKIFQNENGIWKLTKNIEDVCIPPKVYHIIEKRLERGGEEYRKLLDFASVIGDTFSSNTLALALKQERISVLEQLRKIEHRHGLVHPKNGNFKFDHGKIKEVLYKRIPKDLRMEYHLTIAHSLEELNKDDLEGIAEELAFHYSNCGDKEKALFYLIKAAEKAKKEYSSEDAIRYYNQALKLEEDEKRRLEIIEEMEDIHDQKSEVDKVNP